MSLTNCPSCGRQTSEKLDKCKYCDASLPQKQKEDTNERIILGDVEPIKQKPLNFSILKIASVILIVIVLVVIGVYFMLKNSPLYTMDNFFSGKRGDNNSGEHPLTFQESRRYFDSISTTEMKIERGRDSLRSVEPQKIDSLIKLMKGNLLPADTLKAYLIRSPVSNFEFLNSFGGLYPDDVSLLEIPIIQKNLINILRDKYAFLTKNWEVQTPIKIDSGFLYTDGFIAHNCCDPFFILMADIQRGVLFVGILEDGTAKIYSEYGQQVGVAISKTPRKLVDWAKSLNDIKENERNARQELAIFEQMNWSVIGISKQKFQSLMEFLPVQNRPIMQGSYATRKDKDGSSSTFLFLKDTLVECEFLFQDNIADQGRFLNQHFLLLRGSVEFGWLEYIGSNRDRTVFVRLDEDVSNSPFVNFVHVKYSSIHFPKDMQVHTIHYKTEKPQIENFRDSRDGKSYVSVKIGEQTIMAQNLAHQVQGGCFSYENDPKNITVYGYLYDWETAKNICPQGWHLPNDDEWDKLTTYLGGEKYAGGKLKETGTLHWKQINVGASNSSGFNAIPSGGALKIQTVSFFSIGVCAYWWSATEKNTKDAWFRTICCNNEAISRTSESKDRFFSVRCIKNK